MSESVKELLKGKGLLAELEDCCNEEEAIDVLKREKLWGEVVDYPELEALKESYKNGEVEADGTLSLSQLDKVAGGSRGKKGQSKRLNPKNESNGAPSAKKKCGVSVDDIPVDGDNEVPVKDEYTGEQPVEENRVNLDIPMSRDNDKDDVADTAMPEGEKDGILNDKEIEEEQDEKKDGKDEADTAMPEGEEDGILKDKEIEEEQDEKKDGKDEADTAMPEGEKDGILKDEKNPAIEDEEEEEEENTADKYLSKIIETIDDMVGHVDIDAINQKKLMIEAGNYKEKIIVTDSVGQLLSKYELTEKDFNCPDPVIHDDWEDEKKEGISRIAAQICNIYAHIELKGTVSEEDTDRVYNMIDFTKELLNEGWLTTKDNSSLNPQCVLSMIYLESVIHKHFSTDDVRIKFEIFVFDRFLPRYFSKKSFKLEKNMSKLVFEELINKFPFACIDNIICKCCRDICLELDYEIHKRYTLCTQKLKNEIKQSTEKLEEKIKNYLRDLYTNGDVVNKVRTLFTIFSPYPNERFRQLLTDVILNTCSVENEFLKKYFEESVGFETLYEILDELPEEKIEIIKFSGKDEPTTLDVLFSLKDSIRDESVKNQLFKIILDFAKESLQKKLSGKIQGTLKESLEKYRAKKLHIHTRKIPIDTIEMIEADNVMDVYKHLPSEYQQKAIYKMNYSEEELPVDLILHTKSPVDRALYYLQKLVPDMEEFSEEDIDKMKIAQTEEKVRIIGGEWDNIPPEYKVLFHDLGITLFEIVSEPLPLGHVALYNSTLDRLYMHQTSDMTPKLLHNLKSSNQNPIERKAEVMDSRGAVIKNKIFLFKEDGSFNELRKLNLTRDYLILAALAKAKLSLEKPLFISPALNGEILSCSALPGSRPLSSYKLVELACEVFDNMGSSFFKKVFFHQFLCPKYISMRKRDEYSGRFNRLRNTIVLAHTYSGRTLSHELGHAMDFRLGKNNSLYLYSDSRPEFKNAIQLTAKNFVSFNPVSHIYTLTSAGEAVIACIEKLREEGKNEEAIIILDIFNITVWQGTEGKCNMLRKFQEIENLSKPVQNRIHKNENQMKKTEIFAEINASIMCTRSALLPLAEHMPLLFISAVSAMYGPFTGITNPDHKKITEAVVKRILNITDSRVNMEELKVAVQNAKNEYLQCLN